jgi:hypothetical protein
MDLIPLDSSPIVPDVRDVDAKSMLAGSAYPPQTGGAGGRRRDEVDVANETPTRLRTSIRASGYDQGLIHKAVSRRAALQPQSTTPASVLHSTSADTADTPPRESASSRAASQAQDTAPVLPNQFTSAGAACTPPREFSQGPLTAPDHILFQRPSTPPNVTHLPSRKISLPPAPQFIGHSSGLQRDTSSPPRASGSSHRYTPVPDDGPGDVFSSSYLAPQLPLDTGNRLPTPSVSWDDDVVLSNLANAPVTNVIPPTPALDVHRVPSPATSSPPADSVRKSKPSATGRLSEENKAILENCFKMIEDIIVEASNETSLPTQQVLSMWRRQSTRTNQNINIWNAYQKYFFANPKAEIGRLDRQPGKSPPICLTSWD